MSTETPQQTNSCNTPTEVKELQIIDTDMIVVAEPQKKYPSITARDFATILGENPFETAWTLLEKKVENKHHFSGNSFTKHGIKYEKEAIQTYEYYSNTKVNSELKNMKHKDYEFITGRPDGISDSECIIEIKCPNKKRNKLIPEAIPRQYYYQCQVYMEIMNREICHYVEYYINEKTQEKDFQYCSIIRDRQWFKTTMPIIQKFYDEVKHYCDLGNLDTHSIRLAEHSWDHYIKN
tara:strand:- start:1925 stop:2632 length:708 start_codon:yes stop_codon:yes gene_type:complete